MTASRQTTSAAVTGGPAALVLEDGRIHRGTAFGTTGVALGEAVFTTGMTGYQETLTDPSYRRQVVIATAPQIGNTGWVAPTGLDDNGGRDDNESNRIWVAGLVIRDLSPRPSNWRSSGSLPDELAAQGVVGIADVDTRGLTRHLRTAGAMRCGIFSGAELTTDEQMLQRVRQIPPMAGADLAGEVTTAAAYLVPATGDRICSVAAIDLGIKANTPRMFAARGVDTYVLPAAATIDDVLALNDGTGVDGVFLSNGPGDPATADPVVELTKEVLRRGIPFFGICFGNQILGRALGFGTYKLAFGHRGINQPVADLRTGRVLVTAQNHGFAIEYPAAPSEVVDTEFGRARVAFSCLNDGVVEGLECLDTPAFSVQFHPEAAAGPHDAGYLFDEFVTMMAAGRQGNADATS
ncbi:glutamine-hydrolyzing carbamoyl-phosphate synthase small subunit [Nakamurella lactea]|uniref:glutamine-hydrolyzing carbamoyl-phosphate synthase small subunit n=1 Tax=Nakamurella lactea TaxID=459515 RepID=UPI000419F04A|nr:glutamine-hydrolyzing carbamoyl-phosphate synthase small subunit [Nakamurella lactea]